jgi:hypothetical protein
MNDFAGKEYEFAVGSLQGLRAWNIDDKGRLHGVTHKEVWRPGENVSVCKRVTEVACPKAERDRARKAEAGRESKKKRRNRDEVTFYVSPSLDADGTPSIACGDPTCVNGRYHTVASAHRFDPSCQCGFWAYDEASFTAQGEIVGVIDAYGKTTIGTKGFRAEKARILGLSRKDRSGDELSRSALFRLATLYPEVQFYDDLDALIDAHDGVLKTWGEVDEGFWLTPVPEKDSGAFGGLMLPSSSWMYSPSSYRLLSGGSI